MYDYKKYVVWQKAHQLFLNTYAITKKFPDAEKFNFTSQINRAVLSIPTNIAEGCGGNSKKNLLDF